VLRLAAPAAGAEVMGTGIVSVALSLGGQATLSRVLLVIAAVIWAMIAVAVPLRAACDPAGFRREVSSPAALTWVAGSAVLGARLALLGWTAAAVALLAVALALWMLLIGPVLTHWRTPTTGVSLVLTVATQSLAVLAATVGARGHVAWLLDAALVPFGMGLCSYLLVMSRFDSRQLTSGRGDQWITGGALAISTLAAGTVSAGAKALGVLGHGAALDDLAVGLWAASVAWLPALLLTEALRPRLGYDVARWSTVFPFGMYAACSSVVGVAAHAPAITSFARVWVWIALVLWVVVFAATVVTAARQWWRGSR
jgi:tellurite resistance protein TehA-like permease